MITKDASTYTPAIKGTIFSVIFAILLIPPIITIPTNTDNIRPIKNPDEPPSSPNIEEI